MLDYIFEAMEKRELGLASHYLFLYSAVIGVGAKQVFEFGTGLSTRVILEGLKQTGGSLNSCSTEDRKSIVERHSVPDVEEWRHHQGLSEEMVSTLELPPLDLVLHDGAHNAPVVEADLRAVFPKLKQYGLLLLHDTQHSYTGSAMRVAVKKVVQDFDVSLVTLPYGFGLTIFRVETSEHAAVQTCSVDKKTSPHRTKACRL